MLRRLLRGETMSGEMVRRGEDVVSVILSSGLVRL
jgi:hypothetical protein